MSCERTRVLVIEDNPEDAKVVQEAFADMKNADYQVEWVSSVGQGTEKLSQSPFDLILTDLHLPDSQGLDTLITVKEHADRTPVVVLTSVDDEALATQILQNGAQDYLVKGYIQVFHGLLNRSIRYAIERRRAEQKQTELMQTAAETERRRAEMESRRALELDRAYHQLKETQAMLAQAEKMAAVGQLASGIAHEVKNPLSIMQHCVDYLEPTLQEDEKQADVLKVMKESIDTANRVIRGLLDFARPSEPNLELTPLPEVLDAALLLVQNQLQERAIKLERNIPSNIPSLMLDHNVMQQVFVNLFINALHALPDGGKLRINVYLKKLTEKGSEVGTRASDVFRVGETALVCCVEDNGSGIPKELLAEVFNPFYTSKEPGEGVGLGLSITASSIQAHHGTIHLESEEGTGTRVTVMLPLPKKIGTKE